MANLQRLIDLQCDDVRPVCGACRKRGLDCRFEETEARQIRKRYKQAKQRESAYEEFFELIRTTSAEQTAEIFRCVKAGADVSSIVRHIKEGNLLLQLALSPEVYHRYEFAHVYVFPQHLFAQHNLYSDSLINEAVQTGRPRTIEGHHPPDANLDESSSRGHSGTFGGNADQYHAQRNNSHHTAYKMPYHMAVMIEPLLENSTISSWTRASTDERLLRSIIQGYFQYPHPCGPLVHKDLFLEDLAAGRTEFCSQLLVNAVLSIGVVSSSSPSEGSLCAKTSVSKAAVTSPIGQRFGFRVL